MSVASILDRIAALAVERPHDEAFVMTDPDGAEHALTFAGLDSSGERFADELRGLGVGAGDVLVVGAHNHVCYLGLVLGAWRAGAAVLPISPYLSPADTAALLDAAAPLGRCVLVSGAPHEEHPTLVLGDGPDAGLVLAGTPAQRQAPRPDSPYLFMTSGGSTGLPKIMSFALRWVGDRKMPYAQAGLPEQARRADASAARLVCGSLHHTGNFTQVWHLLMTGVTIVMATRFDAAATCAVLRRRDVHGLSLTPHYMMRILALPDLDRGAFERLGRVSHGSAPCPQWVKRAWIELVGAERLFEVFYSSELSGSGRPLVVNGVEWLAKPGTVGKAVDTRILDENGRDVPAGTVGEIYMAQTYGQAHTYVGGRTLRHAPDDERYVSVADLGWLDEDGYLFIADRMSEVLTIDGAAVYPSKVEEVIGAHPLVADVAAVGLTGEGGEPYLHVLVERAPGANLTGDEIRAYCAGRLSTAETPGVVQFTDHLPRTGGGKMRRSVVREMTQSRD